MATGNKRGGRRIKRLGKGLKRFRAGANNALELLQNGRLAAPYRARHEVVHESPAYNLRHYQSDNDPASAPLGEPLLLIPPLMVSSEIYDISPELSAVSWLIDQGADVWLVDYGAPEAEDGSLQRTLDDHILAASDAVDRVVAATGGPVHLVGYSQGGMFAYQTAAWRRSADIGSIVTFGSPVNIWRNLPVNVHEDLSERFLAAAQDMLAGPLDQLPGLPGALTSTGFKVFNVRKEINQVVNLFGLLHDREALERREPKRRFLGGEGFVSWPGPAFREFVDQVVVQNRMSSGGFVIQGRSVSLVDITAPVLYFVGERDDMVKPAAAAAIEKAAPKAQTWRLDVPAGHFGLVVGKRAMSQSWPAVIAWLAWRTGQGPKPTFLDSPETSSTEADAIESQSEARTGALYDLATDVMDGLWHKLGDVSLEAASIIDTMRWHLPRLTRLEGIGDSTRISIGRALSEQAQAIPEATFFLWQGRAFTYREADERVNQLCAALLTLGAGRNQQIGVFMDNHPDYLTAVAAISRIGAVAVLFNAGLRGASLSQAIEVGDPDWLIADATRLPDALGAVPTGRVLAFGAKDSAAIDLEAALDKESTEPQAGVETNPGRGRDVALLMFTSGTTGLPKAARITNRRWAVAALASASACRLTARDTVYCCLPLHHATGMLAACGGALVGGARLALAPRFSTSDFWGDIQRSGVTVVFYVGELCRYLVNAPGGPQGKHRVRLFTGNGMRPGVWQRLLERFGPLQVLEFYSSTEGNVALANLSGDKIGSVGSDLGRGGRIELFRADPSTGALVRDDSGRLEICGVDEPGVLMARIEPENPLGHFDGYTDRRATEGKILRDALETGDAWFDTGDLLRRDVDGDFWFVDRLGDTFRWKGENVSTELVAEVVDRLPFVAMSAVYGASIPRREGRAGMAAIVLREGMAFDPDAFFALCEAHLPEPARPRFIRIVDRLDTTASHKTVKTALQQEGADPGVTRDRMYWRDSGAGTFSTLDEAAWEKLTREEP